MIRRLLHLSCYLLAGSVEEKEEMRMNNNQIMISAAMLEAVWQSRKKDMIDLITPFIMYATATLTSPSEIINLQKVQNYVQQNYAYTNMPESIIKKVFARNPYSSIKRRNHNYYLASPIDQQISQMDARRKECEQYLRILGEKLSVFLNAHCKKSGNFTDSRAIDCLHTFFSRYGLQVGTDDLASVSISPKDYEIDYYIARFIFECKDANSEEYSYLNDLIKGYFLRLALYIQPENGDIKSANYSNTTFFYDTPFLIDLLGYSSNEKEYNATLLHNMLQLQNGKFCYFPHVKQEIIDILYAYKCSLNAETSSNSYRTLDGLNARRYNPDDVDREIKLLPSILESRFGIIEHDIPAYDTKEDGSVDEQKMLGEAEIKQFIRENTRHYTDANLENDVKSALAIHRLRGDYVSDKIETCRFIFVTNNYDFTRAFNIYYKENVSKKTFQLIISDSDLSALTWIKCGEINNLPESELLKNAYCALQPIPEIMKKVDEVFQKLKGSGHLTSEQIVTLRADRAFQNVIWSSSFGEADSITEISVQEAKKKYEEQLMINETARHQAELNEKEKKYQAELNQLTEEMEKISQKHNQEMSNITCELHKQKEAEEQQRKMQAEKNRKLADLYAKQAREKWILPRERLLSVVMFVFSFSGVLGAVFSFAVRSNLLVTIMLVILTIITAISAIDTVTARKYFLMQWLEKKANQYETKEREDKLREYNSLTLSENRELNSFLDG